MPIAATRPPAAPASQPPVTTSVPARAYAPPIAQPALTTAPPVTDAAATLPPSPPVVSGPSPGSVAQCTAVAKQRASDAGVNGYDEKTQRQIYDGTYKDCMQWSPNGG